MAYQGISPYLYRNNLTNVQLLDDISASFNGTTTQFNLTTNGSPFHAVSARSLLIILGGIVQEPDSDYTVSAGVITFTTAPLSGLTFAARNIYGLNRLTGINDGLVTPASLSLGGPEWDTSGNLTVDGNITVSGSLTTSTQSGSSELYYEGIKKLETTNTGVTVDGEVVATSFSGSLNGNITGESTLSTISSEITDTAVDIFVYDTRKDSDGGAWRKRTQHTSWYNETLNTATRGSRKEFPAVAVIVAEQNYIKIYDGDDPDLPMWMVFNTIANGNSQGMANTPMVQLQGVDKVVYMLNGILATGTKNNGSNYGQPIINFISEEVVRMDSESSEGGLWLGNISQRNDAIGYVSQASSGKGYVIVNSAVNDVAMTVLPNAPIDSTTGLPIPTIAVATDSGVSVIKDDGSVVDSQQTQAYSVTFRGSDIFGYAGSGVYSYYTGYTADGFTPAKQYWSLSTTTPLITTNNSGDSVTPNAIGMNQSTGGLVLIDHNTTNFDDGMVAYATTSYNTGWMHGDIKGAFLSDTDATNVTGSELVTNGTFATDSDWEKSSHWTISGGSATMPSTSTYLPLYQYNLGLTAGVKYVASVDVTAISGQIKFDTAASDGGSIAGSQGVVFSTTGTHSFTFIADSNQDGIGLARQVGYTASCTIDNLSIRIAEEDRSVNDNGLQVFGTINKSVVATGAELVAYSEFSASNYLQQPYNSNLGIDSTDSLSIICWTKASNSDSGLEIIFGTGVTSYGKGRYLYLSNGIPYLDTYGGASQQATQAIDDGNWHHLVGIYTPSGGFVYVDGRLVSTPVFQQGYLDQGSTTWFSRIGVSLTNTDPYDNGSIALLRVSNSVPSAEQIKKMYEDEKVLFQENAACTLHGSSDAVTALAYDDSTNLLYAGTSSGRSDFQGLRRINNTTTAVTTAISASNGLVAEQ